MACMYAAYNLLPMSYENLKKLRESGGHNQVSSVACKHLCCGTWVHANESILGKCFANIVIDQPSDGHLNESHQSKLISQSISQLVN